MLRDLGTGMLGVAVLAGFWAVMLVFGVGFPVFAAMHQLYGAGYITHNPVVPEVGWTLGRAILWTALALALLSWAGWREQAGFMVLLLIAWFGTAFFLPLVLSALFILPVHAVVSPAFGVDAIREWRPVLHTVMAVLGGIWGIKVVADSSGGGYDAGPPSYRPSTGGWRMIGDIVGIVSRRPDDDGWSDDSGDSGGGDSD